MYSTNAKYFSVFIVVTRYTLLQGFAIQVLRIVNCANFLKYVLRVQILSRIPHLCVFGWMTLLFSRWCNYIVLSEISGGCKSRIRRHTRPYAHAIWHAMVQRRASSRHDGASSLDLRLSRCSHMPAVSAGTVAVTGGAGYLGSHCVVRLLAGGYSVKACVRDAANGKGFGPAHHSRVP